MPSLKDLRNRIGSVKSTRKITSAMKMVAASKLRRAQEQAEAGQPYANGMAAILARLAGALPPGGNGPRLLSGTGSDKVHLLVVMTADRGLAGGFNAFTVREARRRITALTGEGKQVKLFCVGRKAGDLLRRDHREKIVERMTDVGRKRLSFADATMIANRLLAMYAAGEFDVATLIYNRFVNVITQKPTQLQLIPFAPPAADPAAADATPYEFEPDEEAILEALLPRNVAVQIYRALLDSAAGEQAARMTAMDNATRNAGDIIKALTQNYNRARQAYITKELIEIISGAEAL